MHLQKSQGKWGESLAQKVNAQIIVSATLTWISWFRCAEGRGGSGGIFLRNDDRSLETYTAVGAGDIFFISYN